MKNSSERLKPKLFNSPLETGVRALVILNATYPKAFDLSQLTWFDHLVVHTGDIGGPDSLHPNVPHRSGELLVRRCLIKDSLTLMRRLHLVEAYPNEHGIVYQATDDAYPFVDLLRSKYAMDLKGRAQWLAERVCNLDEKEIKNLIIQKMGRWNIEFHGESAPSGEK